MRTRSQVWNNLPILNHSRPTPVNPRQWRHCWGSVVGDDGVIMYQNTLYMAVAVEWLATTTTTTTTTPPFWVGLFGAVSTHGVSLHITWFVSSYISFNNFSGQSLHSLYPSLIWSQRPAAFDSSCKKSMRKCKNNIVDYSAAFGLLL